MKVFHPNIHIVSNYMDFDEDVSQVKSLLGWEWTWVGTTSQGTSPQTPTLTREERARKACWLLCPRAVPTYLLMPSKDSYL